MLAFFVKSQHDRFFESLGCRAGHILDRLAIPLDLAAFNGVFRLASDISDLYLNYY